LEWHNNLSEQPIEPQEPYHSFIIQGIAQGTPSEIHLKLKDLLSSESWIPVIDISVMRRLQIEEIIGKEERLGRNYTS
jgi:hypothetical protein